MGKILTFAPLALFAYQIFLASTGKNSLTVFNLVPHHSLTAVLALLGTAPMQIIAEYNQLLQAISF